MLQPISSSTPTHQPSAPAEQHPAARTQVAAQSRIFQLPPASVRAAQWVPLTTHLQPESSSSSSSSSTSHTGLRILTDTAANAAAARVQEAARPVVMAPQAESSSSSSDSCSPLAFEITLRALGPQSLSSLFDRLKEEQEALKKSIQDLEKQQQEAKIQFQQKDSEYRTAQHQQLQQLAQVASKIFHVKSTRSRLFPEPPPPSKRARAEPIPGPEEGEIRNASGKNLPSKQARTEPLSGDETEEEREIEPQSASGRKRSPTRFQTHLNLPPGSEIHIAHTTRKGEQIHASCKIIDDKHVLFKEKRYPLGTVHKILMSNAGIAGEQSAMKLWFFVDPVHGKEFLFERRIRIEKTPPQ